MLPLEDSIVLSIGGFCPLMTVQLGPRLLLKHIPKKPFDVIERGAERRAQFLLC
jgi:hypothetical protein